MCESNFKTVMVRKMMVQHYGALSLLLEDPDLIPSSHMAVYNHV